MENEEINSNESSFEDNWRQIAFSYTQINDFLRLIALPFEIAKNELKFGTPVFKCLTVGFYFFVLVIKNELNKQLYEDLMNLAVRFEAFGNESDRFYYDEYERWLILMDSANKIIDEYKFGS